MNPHLLSGAFGALLALAGSTAIDNLNCSKLDTKHVLLVEGQTSVSILPSCITIEDKESGATCLISSKGIVFSRDDGSSETGSASLLYLPESGALLTLIHEEATASLSALGGAEPEASLRASFAANAGAIVASPESAALGIVDRGKGSVMTGTDCLWNLDKTPEARGENRSRSGDQDQGATTVFVTRTGDKYHLAGCQYLRSSMIPMDLSEAIKRFTPCKVCIPRGN